MPEAASQAARAEWMSVLAKADAGALAAAFDALGLAPEFDWLRRPEIGAVMVQGRAGGTGAPFNLGEMTVTRCALKLADGRVGHAYVPGRDREKARIAALCDALMQGAEADAVATAVLEPMRRAADDRRARLARKAAATRVDFFTMVRGEDK
ncbi:MAG: phosphonate C-P lyase system protein PhnG [Alphaproteobacteria bacterium]|nr:MAG: phosphonate C-P lyase system protein PhnG [Alphaproteobacteria bacterium]